MRPVSLLTPLLVQLYAAEKEILLDKTLAVLPHTAVELGRWRAKLESSGVVQDPECEKDVVCGGLRPECKNAQCQDLREFNASVGECICESPKDCGREALPTPATTSITGCAQICEKNPECQAFEGYYHRPGNFDCKLFRTRQNQESGAPATLTGNGRRKASEYDVFCYNKPDRESLCGRHVGCLATPGHFCCPDRRGELLLCCSTPSVGLFGSFCTAILALMLACSVFFNCRTWGKPAIATPANDVPGSTDVSFPTPVRGHQISLLEYNDLQSSLGAAGRYLIAFVNPGSGDQSGKRFERLFEALLAQNGKICKLPNDLESGLKLAADLLRESRDVALLACGGDGTVTWVLSELNDRREALFKNIRLPPVGIVPLGTGNDLARSLGWGPALTDNFQLLSYVQRAMKAETVLLDQWRLTLRPSHLLPPSLRQRGTVEFIGYFTNYFSVGMDAHTAYEVGRVRSSGFGMLLYGSEAVRRQVSPNDGRLEVFTRQGPYGVIGMTLAKKVLKAPCGNVDIAFQPRRVEMRLKKGQHFQMDGEPWVLNAACTAVIERHTKVRMLCPNEDGPGAGVWSGSQKRHFWHSRRQGSAASSAGEQELCASLASRPSSQT